MDEGAVEFWMRLQRKNSVFIFEEGVFAKAVRACAAGFGGQSDHLILVPSVYAHLLAFKLIVGQADAQAAGKFLNMPTHGLGDDLVTKTYSNQGFFRSNNAQDERL